MTDQKKTATLTEWAKRFEALIQEAEADNVTVEATSCCCGGGTVLMRGPEPSVWII